MTLTIEQMEARIARSKNRMAALAAQAECDYRRHLASLERALLRKEQQRAEREVTFQEHLDRVIIRLGKNALHPAVAGRLHLIDLVRAGHHPGTGELDVPREPYSRVYMRASIADTRSVVGSSAAMAAGE